MDWKPKALSLLAWSEWTNAGTSDAFWIDRVVLQHICIRKSFADRFIPPQYKIELFCPLGQLASQHNTSSLSIAAKNSTALNMASKLTFTPTEAVPGILAELNASFRSGKTTPIEWRKEQLKNLWKLRRYKSSSSQDEVVHNLE